MGRRNSLMTTQMPAQPARNGFEALPRAEKQWFLMRAQSLPRTFAKERPATNRMPVARAG
jgi:hypothetical protein